MRGCVLSTIRLYSGVSNELIPFGTMHVQGFDVLGTRLLVYPCSIAKLARRELEHPLENRERSILLLGQLDRDVCRGRSSSGVITRAITFELGHGSVYVVSKNLKTIINPCDLL